MGIYMSQSLFKGWESELALYYGDSDSHQFENKRTLRAIYLIRLAGTFLGSSF